MNQIGRGTAGLGHLLAVEPEGYPRIPVIQIGFNPGTERAGGIETLAAGPHGVILLEVAQGHIIDAGISQHVVHGLGLADLACDTPYDHSHLGLVVHVLAVGGLDNRIIRADNRGGWFHEDHKALRRLRVHSLTLLRHIGGMGPIVLGGTIYLGRNDRRQQAHILVVQGITLTRGLHLLPGQGVPAQLNQIVLAVLLVLLDEGIARSITDGKTRDSHRDSLAPGRVRRGVRSAPQMKAR